MKPAIVNLGLRPGATFVERVLVALDENDDPVDLTGCIPYAQVRADPNASVLVDLAPSLIVAGNVVGTVFVNLSENLFTLTAHGLKAGMCVQFSSTGSLPSPLTVDEFYIIMNEGLDADDFKVMTLEDALISNYVSVDLTSSGSGTLSVAIAQGQILIPEITDEITETFQESPFASWDLMIEDSNGRRMAPFIVGDFPISRGFTDPGYLS